MNLKSIWGMAQNFAIIFGTAEFMHALIFERIYSEGNGETPTRMGSKNLKKKRSHLG